MPKPMDVVVVTGLKVIVTDRKTKRQWVSTFAGDTFLSCVLDTEQHLNSQTLTFVSDVLVAGKPESVRAQVTHDNYYSGGMSITTVGQLESCDPKYHVAVQPIIFIDVADFDCV